MERWNDGWTERVMQPCVRDSKDFKLNDCTLTVLSDNANGI